MKLTSLRRRHGCRSDQRERPRRLLAGALAVALTVAACGGGAADQPLSESSGAAQNNPQAPADILSTRTGAGIAAAGGDLSAFGPDECSLARAVRFAFLGPDLGEFEQVGLGSLTIEDPWRGISAYLTQVNANGGIHGRCVQVSVHQWSWTDPESSFDKVCNAVPAVEPIAVLNLFGDVRGVECLAVQAQLPMFGLYASVPATVQRRSRGRLFLDDGTAGYLLANSIGVALRSEIFAEGDQVGLLYGPPVGAASSAQEYNIGADFDEVVNVTGSQNLIPGVITHVPAKFGQLDLLGIEDRVRLLESGLTTAEQAAAANELSGLSGAERSILGEIEQFYLDAAIEHRDSGVVAVFATAPWFELRRMMRAAERIGWRPRWIASDIQGATLTLTGAPPAQADNFFLVSARRAAGDAQTELDRGCVGLRNAAPGEESFEHRHHTDAWSVLVATCDSLDVTLSALSRISGPPSTEAFVEQLAATHYEAGFGGRLSFGPGDYSGADRFRVLQADPDCVLDEWGCMRAVTDWLAPSAEVPREDG